MLKKFHRFKHQSPSTSLLDCFMRLSTASIELYFTICPGFEQISEDRGSSQTLHSRSANGNACLHELQTCLEEQMLSLPLVIGDSCCFSQHVQFPAICTVKRPSVYHTKSDLYLLEVFTKMSIFSLKVISPTQRRNLRRSAIYQKHFRRP